MTRHLTLTDKSIAMLQEIYKLPSNAGPLTARVLSRQIKGIIDDELIRDTPLLFTDFSKSLKDKKKKGWAPCLAAFLVFCLFMETVEGTVDMFVVSANEESIRHSKQPEYSRNLALDTNHEVEKMPFKQFAFQFHHIYSTHGKDGGSPKPYNPLLDTSLDDLRQEDDAAYDMVCQLRRLLQDNREYLQRSLPHTREIEEFCIDHELPQQGPS